MADAASTGALVVAAMAGGGGVLVGTVVAQAVQLFRDNKQYEREDDRHERERQKAVEDARTARREDRYVAVLTDVVRLRQRARDSIRTVQMWNELRELVDDPSYEERFQPFLDQLLGWRADEGKDLEEAFQTAKAAAHAAYSVASNPVREACAALTNQTNLYSPQALTKSGPVFHPWSAAAEPIDATEYAEHSVKDLTTIIALCEDVDRLIRTELRLD